MIKQGPNAVNLEKTKKATVQNENVARLWRNEGLRSTRTRDKNKRQTSRQEKRGKGRRKGTQQTRRN